MSPRPELSPRRPAPAPARPRHLRVVRGRPAPGRRPPGAFVLLAGLATVCALFALVTVNALLGQTAIRQAEVARRVQAKQEQLAQLKMEVAQMSSGQEIARRAGQIGLVSAPRVVVVSAPTLRASVSPAGGARPAAASPRHGGR